MAQAEEPTAVLELSPEHARILSNMLATYTIRVLDKCDKQCETCTMFEGCFKASKEYTYIERDIVFSVQTQVFDRLLELNWYDQEGQEGQDEIHIQ